MESIQVFVGLDYHQKCIQACVIDREGRVLANQRCDNLGKSIVGFVSRYGRVAGVAIEVSTGAANLAEELVVQTGWPVHLAHPGYVSRMRENPDKTDYSDARLLADLERVGYLPRVWLAPLAIRELRRLVRFRQQLADERRDVRLRIRALLRDHRLVCPTARPWTQAWLWWVSEAAGLPEESRWIMDRQLRRMERIMLEIKEVNNRLTERVTSDAVVQRLQSFKGIGPVTAWTIRAEIGRFDRFRNGKQLARFCGLSPRNASSGTRQADAGLVRAANRQLRTVLIEAAHRLARHEKPWSDLAHGLRLRGKPTCVIIAAVGNRWMRWLYHQMQSLPAAA